MCKKGIALLTTFAMLFTCMAGCAKNDIENEKEVEKSEGSEKQEQTDIDETSELPMYDMKGRVIFHDDYETRQGNVEPDYTKDYNPSEWAGLETINLYISFPASDGDEQIQETEDELNHYLYQRGYQYNVNFVQPSFDDWMAGKTADEMVDQLEQDGTQIDIYVTNDYQNAVQTGRAYPMTEYLESNAGSAIKNKYADILWEKLYSEDGDLYGIPCDTIATARSVYAYNPQIAERYQVDMDYFTGDTSALEEPFAAMLAEDVTPLCLDVTDMLMLNAIGFENLDSIFAIRYEDEKWEAVDFLDDVNAREWYCRLGEQMEQGYLSYSDQLIDLTGYENEDELPAASKYRYRFLSLCDTNLISFFYTANMSYENTYMDTDYYILPVSAYIREPQIDNVLIINAETTKTENALSFLNLFETDEIIRNLLYSGIEGKHYTWIDDVRVFSTAVFAVGLGLGEDRRFLENEKWSQKYTEQIDEMNENIRFSAFYDTEIDYGDMNDAYQNCCAIIQNNALAFLGYYGADTEEKLDEVHQLLIDAGYLELIDFLNEKEW